MTQLFFGSLLLSLVHAVIPNHWLPIVALGKSEKWSLRETVMVTGISGFAHTLSTVSLGIIIGIIGIHLSHSYTIITEKIAPALLIVIGIVYIIIDRVKNHKHQHGFDPDKVNKRSKAAIIVSLVITMFLSPCLEIEAYYLQAASAGFKGILMVSVIYVLITVSGMIFLVLLASKGVKAIQSHFLDHNEKLISGLVLILLGVFAFFSHH